MATLLVEALKGAQVRVLEGVQDSAHLFAAPFTRKGYASKKRKWLLQQAPHTHKHTVPVQAEVAAQQGLIDKVRQAGKLSGILAQELRLAVSLSPFGVRAVRIRRCAQQGTTQLLHPSQHVVADGC